MLLSWTMTLQPGMTATPHEESAWVRASQGGDREAFSNLIRLHQHRVFRMVGRFFRCREDVEDAAQETFLLAWRKLDTYRAKAPFEHWLSRVCLNTCYGKLRREKRDDLSLLDEDLQAPAHDPDASLEVERLLRCLAPQDRFMLLLLEGEGWTIAEIADRLGWTRTNVKVRAHRARKKLRKLLSATTHESSS